MSDPFRDEKESLLAENAKLRDEAARHRVRRRPVLAVVLVAVDFGLVMLLRPFLNGGTEWQFLLAIVPVALIALGAVYFALRS